MNKKIYFPTWKKAPPTMHRFIILLPTMILATLAQTPKQFIYNGFHEANFHLDGVATIHSNGLLQLTNTSEKQKGHAFYPTPLNFRKYLSFSTTYAFAIYPQLPTLSGHGIALVISPSMDFTGAAAGEYMGIMNASNNGLTTNHIIAVELDTVQSKAVGDINDNHVGINVNSMRSIAAAPVEYYNDKKGKNESLALLSGKPMQIWIDYDDREMVIKVTVAPLGHPKPSRLLLSKYTNLSAVFQDSMYVGLSSATGSAPSRHYILGWRFSQSGQAQGLDLSKLPRLPRLGPKRKILNQTSIMLLVLVSILLIIIVGVAYAVWRKKYAEVIEDWEKEYLHQRFRYKDLYKSTKGFKDKEMLGSGGFGKVYKGVLPHNKVEVAVKRVSHNSKQGMKEFLAEITSMGKLRHRNLVQLLGYCRRKGELLLVYEYMPNGSLDKFLYGKQKPNLSWEQRFKIIRGVASSLLYLHEEWEQTVLHRDVKPSNVLLDADMNARLGDFGLARLYDRGTDPQTTHLVGTVGYLAPELTRTGKANSRTDVFAFGIFILEIACGKRPLSMHMEDLYGHATLIDWVSDCWKRQVILDAVDPKLGNNYSAEEMEVILKLGLLCSHSRPEARPMMRQVMQFLDGDAIVPEIPSDIAGYSLVSSGSTTSASFPSSSTKASIYCLSTSDSVFQTGR